ALGILLNSTRCMRYEHPHLRTVIENYTHTLKALGQSEEDIEVELRKRLAEHKIQNEHALLTGQ
ncbi:MAG TPA: hypothetical protein P5149_14200, partial [Candidatus Competibacteraceae bacterium]|nr:hypothetical protein [Candidatus Competibacteraceae bacterium]